MVRAGHIDFAHHRFLAGAAMSLRTPLGRVLGLGTAMEGTEHWWAQRVSAVALLLLGAWFVIAIVMLDGLDHAAAVAFVGAPWNGVLLTLLSVTLAYHSYLGVQVVVEDYVHAPGIKVVSLMFSRFAHIFVAVAAVYAVVRVGISA